MPLDTYTYHICEIPPTIRVLSFRLTATVCGQYNSDYRKRWRDVISQYPGHSHGYKSIMVALLKANIRYGLFAQMNQNAKIFNSFVV